MSARAVWRNLHRGARCVAARNGADFHCGMAPAGFIGARPVSFRDGAARALDCSEWAGLALAGQHDVRCSGPSYTLWRFSMGSFPSFRPVLP